MSQYEEFEGGYYMTEPGPEFAFEPSAEPIGEGLIGKSFGVNLFIVVLTLRQRRGWPFASRGSLGGAEKDIHLSH